MRNLVLSPPVLAFAVGTRAALAFGLGMVLSRRMSEERGRKLGWTLVAIGIATTLPAVALLRRRGRRPRALAGESSGVDARLIGAQRFPRKGDDW